MSGTGKRHNRNMTTNDPNFWKNIDVSTDSKTGHFVVSKKIPQHNINAPHQAVISLTVELMERTAEGQVTGIPIQRFGKVYTVLGKNQEECQEKLKIFLEKLNG